MCTGKIQSWARQRAEKSGRSVDHISGRRMAALVVATFAVGVEPSHSRLRRSAILGQLGWEALRTASGGGQRFSLPWGAEAQSERAEHSSAY